MSTIDRNRAGRLMREAGIDALALFQPEAFHYAIGAPSGVASMWGRAGAAIALVPAEADLGLSAIVSDHASASIARAAPEVDLRHHRIWIDMLDVTGADSVSRIDAAYRSVQGRGHRPETFDRLQAFGLLGDRLHEQGLAGAKIGVDLEFVPAADFEALKTALPDIRFVDGSAVLRRLKAVKTLPEIERLRCAAKAAEAGLVRMAAAIRPGAPLALLSDEWKAGARAAAGQSGFALTGHWDYISVGPDLSDAGAIVTPGALVKADVGTLVAGYSSDGARSFVYGSPEPVAADVYRILETAFDLALQEIRPGNTFGAVHAAALSSIHRAGLSGYDRGHFGHSVGGGVGIEEWPFFSRDSREIIEPNMVLALETPFYGQGMGALMIEDQFLVTEEGVECMMTLPRSLQDVSRR